MQEPLVSVITIFLDAAPYLADAVASVRAQTYGNWELLLVDDGSTDGSSEIARALAADDPTRVRHLEHRDHANHGMSASRNLGLQHARGELVAFLDADDVWLPEKLERQVAILRADAAAAMTYGPAQLWYGWTGREEDVRRDRDARPGVATDASYPAPALLEVFLRDGNVTPSPSGVVVRRAVATAVGGFEPAFRGMFEDQVFYAKVCLRWPVYVSGSGWYRYRIHPASCCVSADREGRRAEPLRDYLQWVESYLRSARCPDARLHEIVQRRLWPFRHPRRHRAGQAVAALLGGPRLRGARAVLPRSLRTLALRALVP